jgi:CspA family cold shock protein
MEDSGCKINRDKATFSGIQLEEFLRMASGTVKFFNEEKGFGFIKPDNGSADIFVHISALQASGIRGLQQNQKVSFDTEPDRQGKGPKAVNIEIL